MADLPLIPVRPGDNGELRDAEGRLIGHIYGHRQSGRLDFIVRAVNRDAIFDEMVEVLAEYLILGAWRCTISKAHADKALAVLSKVREASK